MNTAEKLTAIRARCVELLAIAEKRTPGKWKIENQDSGIETETFIACGDDCITNGWNLDGSDMDDFTFIASCAGPAEAGWRATIAAIDACQQIKYTSHITTRAFQEAAQIQNSIITAWEGIV
jgi:hypothetical protein